MPRPRPRGSGVRIRRGIQPVAEWMTGRRDWRVKVVTMLHRGWAPMWACCSAAGIGGFPVLDGIEALTVFGDNDDAGMDGARECAIGWADAAREVTVHIPRQDGADWNSLNAAGGAA